MKKFFTNLLVVFAKAAKPYLKQFITEKVLPELEAKLSEFNAKEANLKDYVTKLVNDYIAKI